MIKKKSKIILIRIIIIQMCCIDEECFKMFLSMETKECLAIFLLSCLTLPWEVCRNFEIQASVCSEKKNPHVSQDQCQEYKCQSFVATDERFIRHRWKWKKNCQTSKLKISNISSFIEIRIKVNDFPMCTAHESQRQSLRLFLLNVAMTHFPQCTCSMAPLQ